MFLPMTKQMAITKEVRARITESTIGNNQAFDNGFGPLAGPQRSSLSMTKRKRTFCRIYGCIFVPATVNAVLSGL